VPTKGGDLLATLTFGEKQAIAMDRRVNITARSEQQKRLLSDASSVRTLADVGDGGR
jgi:hypothetical protein